MKVQFERLGLPVLLCSFVVLALAYSVTTPVGEAPDEVTHFAYVQYLIAHHRLPTPEGAVLGESHQPPLYYLIAAVATFWVPQQDFQVIANPDFVLDDPQTPNLLLHTRREAFPYQGGALAWHLARALSILMGAVTVWATWRIAKEIFSGDQWIALGSAAFVAFLPGFLFISAVLNNDNLVVMFSTLSVLQIIRMTRRSLNVRDTALLGVLLGLTVLAKVSGLVVWLFGAAMFFFLALAQKEWRRVAIHSAICFGIAAAVIAPWVIYNLLTVGDPLGWSSYLAIISVRQTPITWDVAVAIARGLFRSFWGSFGGAGHLRMSDAVYAMLGAVGILALSGWLLFARDARRQQIAPGVRSLFAEFSLFWLFLLAAYVRWSLTDLAAGQARLLYPGLPLLAIFLFAGFARVFSSNKRIALGAWAAGFLALSLAALFYINSLFSPAPQNPAALTRLDGAAAPADFGQTIRVLDYRVEPTRVAPGNPLEVQVQWQALSDPSDDYWLLLQLFRAREQLANKDGVPSAGHPTTDWWKKDQVFVSHHTLVVPSDAAPGTYTLRLGLHPFERWEWLPVRGQDMLDLGKIEVISNPQ